MDKQEILQSQNYEAFTRLLREYNCQDCSLGHSRTQMVIDRGNPSSSALFIGEAPGRTEDETGKAFVGRAGKLLDSLLAELSFEVEKDALIANIVKCRPPNNRQPETNEAKTCLPFLKKQIGLVSPKVMALLGRTAVKHLFPEMAKTAMRDLAGRPFQHPEYPGVDVVVLFHPAYVLRDPRKKKEFRGQLEAVVELMSRRRTGIIRLQTEG